MDERHVWKWSNAIGGQRADKRQDALQEGMGQRKMKGGPCHIGREQTPNGLQQANSPDLMMCETGTLVKS